MASSASSANMFRDQQYSIPSNKNIDLQLVEYYQKDNVDFEEGNGHSYELFMFGVLEDSRSIAVKVTGYKPYFFVEVPSSWSDTDTTKFKEWLEEQSYKNYKGDTKTYAYPLRGSEFTIERKIKFDGFQNNNKTKFLKLTFCSLYAFRLISKFFIGYLNKPIRPQTLSFRPFTPRLYESDLQPMLRFFHEKDIKTCGWVRLPRGKFFSPSLDDKFSNCQIDCEIEWTDIIPIEKDSIGPLMVASFDIECTSGDGSFPQYTNPEDKIIQIGTTFERYGDRNAKLNTIITLDTCDPIEGATVIACRTETELLREWIKLMKKVDPDLITGYNINGFDFDYIAGRAKHLGCEKEIYSFTRLKDVKSRLIEKKLMSGALGENYLHYLDIPGVIILDLLAYVRREYKLDSYRLDAVAEKFMGMNKNDVSPNMIFKYQKEGPDKRKIIAEYCIQDCRLCNELILKFCCLENTFGMATTCYIPNNYIHFRGQGIKGYSLVAKECRDYGYIIPVLVKDEGGSYSGATVLTANSGFHLRPVSCLDFASLYPSCMLSHNLCISSIVTDDSMLNLPGKQYKTVRWEDKKTGEEKSYTYVQPELDSEGKINEEDRGVLPKILQKLLQKRKDTRKLQKIEKDPFKKNVLNGLQLSYKITANSVYGLLGATTSAISRPEVAESITTTGRALLKFAADNVTKHYWGSEIVYGDTDSVFIAFKLINHCEDCRYHKDRISERYDKYEKIKDKRVSEWGNQAVEHSVIESAMRDSPYAIYRECECPTFDLMSKDALKESIRLGFEAEKLLSDMLPRPHVLEYEKTYHPYLLFTKKRYIGYLYETKTADEDRVLDYKGIVLKRRDNAKIVKTVYKGCIDELLQGSEEGAINFLRKKLREVVDTKCPIEQFVLSKTLKSLNSYKIRVNKVPISIPDAKEMIVNKVRSVFNVPGVLDRNKLMTFLDAEDVSGEDIVKGIEGCTELKFNRNFLISLEEQVVVELQKKISQGHVVLNEKIKAEDPGQAYESNERIPYCFIVPKGPKVKGTKLKQGDMIETPDRIKEQKLKIDYAYYITNQLKEPVTQLFQFSQNAGVCVSMFEEMEKECDRKKKGIRDISAIFGGAPVVTGKRKKRGVKK